MCRHFVAARFRNCLQPKEGYRRALAAALDAERAGHGWMAAECYRNVALCIKFGGVGDTFSWQQFQDIVHKGKHWLTTSQPWVPKVAYDAMVEKYVRIYTGIPEWLGQHDLAFMKAAVCRPDTQRDPSECVYRTCKACGKKAVMMSKCSRCKAVHYCR
jgi:hypothetical protein